jgi:ATP adenylyltransferase
MRNLFTPWRLSYVMSLKSGAGCVLCDAQRQDDPSSLILHRALHNFIILNLYPYNNGHLMIVPFKHLARLSESEPAQRAEMMELVLRCQEALERAYHPEGFNVGLNLGRCAGAGLADHFHMHVVPRWTGDTNFMSVVGDTRVVPEEPKQSYERLKSYFNY